MWYHNGLANHPSTSPKELPDLPVGTSFVSAWISHYLGPKETLVGTLNTVAAMGPSEAFCWEQGVSLELTLSRW